MQRGSSAGARRKLDPDQPQLGLETLEQISVAAAEAVEEATSRSSDTPRPPRACWRNLGALPAHLPRIETLIDVEGKSCPCCGGALHPIGEDTSEMLDIVPAQLRVKVIRRPRYACRACGGGGGAGTGPRSARSRAGWRRKPCWLMCWWPSMPTFCPLPPGPDLRPVADRARPLDLMRLGSRACWCWSRCGACCADTS